MDAITVCWVFFALFAKHLIVDFPLQVKYQYSNKGTYGHMGGILHAALHIIGTIIALLLVLGMSALPIILALALADGVIHYHIDWAKMNLNKYWNLQPTTSEQFWWLLGIDQWLHQLTYIGIVVVLHKHFIAG